MRRGLRPRHALVLQRGVQYLRVDRVFGKPVPQYSQVPITFPPAHALINGKWRRCVPNSGNCTILVAALINGFCDVTVRRIKALVAEWQTLRT